MFLHRSAHLQGILFIHEDVHGHGGGRMSRTAIVTLKICTCMLVSTMVMLNCGRRASRSECEGNTMALDPLEFRQTDLVKFGSLLLIEDLSLKRALGHPYTR